MHRQEPQKFTEKPAHAWYYQRTMKRLAPQGSWSETWMTPETIS
jgi:hypothetical protein